METVALWTLAGLLLWNLFFRAIPELGRMKAETKRMREQVTALRAGLRSK